MRIDRNIKLWLPLMALLALTAFTVKAVPQERFHRLDSLIAVQPQIIAAKEARLAQMKDVLAGLTSSTDRYQAMKRLCEISSSAK